jgi:hypothetical protein
MKLIGWASAHQTSIQGDDPLRIVAPFLLRFAGDYATL